MDEAEFLQVIQQAYQDALAKTGDSRKAHKIAEALRSSLIISLAKAAAIRATEER